jgi:hypothetical protein
MMCCAFVALLVAALAAGRNALGAALAWRLTRRWVAGLAGVAIVLLAGSAVAAQYFDDAATRAPAAGHGVLAGFLTGPICGFGPAPEGADAPAPR